MEASSSLTSHSFITELWIVKTAWYWHKNRQLDQWNQQKDLYINPHNYEQLIFEKKLKLNNGKCKVSSTNGAGITGCQHVED